MGFEFFPIFFYITDPLWDTQRPSSGFKVHYLHKGLKWSEVLLDLDGKDVCGPLLLKRTPRTPSKQQGCRNTKFMFNETRR